MSGGLMSGGLKSGGLRPLAPCDGYTWTPVPPAKCLLTAAGAL